MRGPRPHLAARAPPPDRGPLAARRVERRHSPVFFVPAPGPVEVDASAAWLPGEPAGRLVGGGDASGGSEEVVVVRPVGSGLAAAAAGRFRRGYEASPGPRRKLS